MKHILIGISGPRELDIPDGYTVIEEGNIESGDLYLVGGAHNYANNCIKEANFHPFQEDSFGQPIGYYSITVRPIGLEK